MSDTAPRHQTQDLPRPSMAAYVSHFGLRMEAFSLAADPAFFHQSPGHAEAFAALKLGVLARRGLIVMVGEVGTGKTTVIRYLSNELGPRVRTSAVSNTRFSFDEILLQAVAAFGVECESQKAIDLIGKLNAFLHECAEDGGTAVLVIDEAQHLDDDTLERLRLLSNCETGTTKLLQIVLVGQPELETRLGQSHLLQLADRVAVRCHLDRLSREGSITYIASRLECAGGSPSIFTDGALSVVARESDGIPRTINIVCHNAMLFAYGDGAKQVSKEHVRLAVHERKARVLLRHRKARKGPRRNIRNGSALRTFRPWLSATAVLALCAVIALAARSHVPAGSISRLTQAEEVTLLSQLFDAPQERSPAVARGVAAQAESVSLPPVDVASVSRRPGAAPGMPGALAATVMSAGREPAAIAVSSKRPATPTDSDMGRRAFRVSEARAAGRVGDEAAELTPRPLREVTVRRGEGRRAFAREVYREDSTEILNSIQKVNPQVLRVDRLTAGDALRFPEPAGTAIREPGNRSVREVTVPPGIGLRALAREVYGNDSPNIINQIVMANPQITDADHIMAGDVVRFPELSEYE